ncbi:antitoxin Xre/MbcA/ParS toxin-binding domain-containing protein [Jatrophihabitans sp.]|uniref:antitoxin Xre/MbcA/ParS toxin-binding domain-containing protein n=1 Tax=Jatrophihabitans sp. TaxID=1932789 RepID=UPI002B95B3BE|nr:antitoxin Xre/MbcA/ParS toxin-binding domain-containing protein [Jatrophihabitans sp.]
MSGTNSDPTNPQPAKRRRAAAKPARRSVALPTAVAGRVTVRADAATAFSPVATVERLVAVLGNNTLARILGVSISQPSRWRTGKEQISPENRRKLTDLNHVLERLLLEVYPDQAEDWLSSPNAHLGGGIPLNVLMLYGPAAVLEAIEALAGGAYA